MQTILAILKRAGGWHPGLSLRIENPRRIFEESSLKELAESIRVQGVLSPLLVRPITDQSFEIVAGARRYRAAQIIASR